MSEHDADLSRLLAALADAEPEAGEAHHAAPDPGFVGRVMGQLPPPIRGSRLSPVRRARLLALFYVGAAVLAVLVSLLVPETLSIWSDRVHALAPIASDLTAAAGPGRAAMVAVALLVGSLGLLLALAPARLDTPAT